ncbi:trypsin-like peptidase domain-containing protein [Streptomyces sp. LX-29]|uniref:S1C family serine protease n=1 Tax=Streptomyces sp. LX-29 TaxID=2900152 RepID=UPI00240D5CBB|nr:trypsin-like peptidase domain-containing protein [Streptomyces sp. LX-29]WFB08377.1 trypsin-like peptidase domain-containing protein [Streptomyces sp. LX-29]
MSTENEGAAVPSAASPAPDVEPAVAHAESGPAPERATGPTAGATSAARETREAQADGDYDLPAPAPASPPDVAAPTEPLAPAPALETPPTPELAATTAMPATAAAVGSAAPPSPPPPPPAQDGSGTWWDGTGAGAPYGSGGPVAGAAGGGFAGGPGGGAWGAPPMPPPPSGRGRSGGIVAAVLAAVLVAGGIGGGVGYWAADRDETSTSTTVSSSGDPKAESRAPGSVADIAGKALPSVVTIEARGSNGEGGTGTGFVYDKQGHILTNNHVVASAADSGRLTATFSDGKRYDAEVIGRAEGYDVAVIKLKNAPDGLNPLPLGDSDKVSVGDATVAIGAPFGLSGTVTTGIVSAKNRPVASSDGGGTNASYMSALQTDASINPGNSGGPLLNADGAVIGVNSAIQSAGGGGGFGGGSQQSGSIGLGFAIPINQGKNVADQLIKTGQPVYPVIEATVNMKDTGNGATIASTGAGGSDAVAPGGPADRAGLKPGDVITKLDDTVIDSGPTLISEIWTHQPGDKVTITYVRDGKQSTTQLTLGERQGDS